MRLPSRRRRATLDPVTPTSAAERLAAGLQVAMDGVAETSAKLFDKGDYAGVIRYVDGATGSFDELNNLGCAYAVLAARGDVSLWLPAADALRKSAKSPDRESRDRANKNLGLVATESGGVVVVQK